MANISLKGVTFPSTCSASPTGEGELNLEILDKELLVLAGPSGSGKTALLRMIAGLEEIGRGELFIEGKKALGVKEREISMVFPEGALFPAKTVHENLAFGLKLRKVPKAEMTRRIKEAATMLGLESMQEKRVESICGPDSQLFRRRIALGRAMVRQPKAYLLDAPLNGLDGIAKRQFQAEVVQLHERLQATMIYATDDPLEALAVATRVAVIKDGAIQQEATPADIYQRPANLFVAGFFGATSMNLIAGRLKEVGTQIQFREAGEGSIQCVLPELPAARQMVGNEVVLGIRPEQIHPIQPGVRDASGSDHPVIKGLADLIEPRGAETLVHFQTGAHSLASRCEGFLDRSHAGHRMQFEFDLSKACLFDPGTTLRI